MFISFEIFLAWSFLYGLKGFLKNFVKLLSQYRNRAQNYIYLYISLKNSHFLWNHPSFIFKMHGLQKFRIKHVYFRVYKNYIGFSISMHCLFEIDFEPVCQFANQYIQEAVMGRAFQNKMDCACLFSILLVNILRLTNIDLNILPIMQYSSLWLSLNILFFYWYYIFFSQHLRSKSKLCFV